MTRNYTGRKQGRNILFFMTILLTGMIFLTGCYSSYDVQTFRKNTRGEKEFSFYDYRNGDEVHWKAYFKDDSISALYKDGTKIPDSEIQNYSDMIYDKVEDIADLRREDHVKVFKFDGDDLKMNMDRMKENIHKGKNHLKFRIHKDLKDDMDKLSIEMDQLKDKKFDIHINPEKLKHKMQGLKELRKLHKDSSDAFVFEFDSEGLEDEIRNLTEELKNIDIDIDIPDIDIDLSDLDENLKELDIHLKDIDKDLENLDKFFDELKTEMVKDKLINSTEDEISIRLEKDRMYVNDKEVPAETYQKYRELYKKHTGKDFEGNNNFYFNKD